MATGLTARIRLVKCPRCLRLLPELPGIPVYKCGGCDAILVAKNRTDDSHNTGLGSLNRDSVQRHEVNPPTEDKQPSTSNHEAIIPPHGESSLDLNNRRHTNESGEWNSEEQRNARNDDESHHENCETSDGDKAEEASISSSSHETIIPSSGECVIDPDVEKDQDESGDSSSEQLVRRKFDERQTYARNNDESHASHDGPSGFPNQVYLEEEFAYHENDELPCRDALEPEEYSISSPETTILSSDECFIDPNDVKDRKESGDVSQEQLAQIMSSECLENAGSNDESRVFHDEQPSCSNQSSSRIEFASHGNADLSGLDSIKATETSTSSHEVLTITFSGESVLDPNDEKDQKEDEDNPREQLVQISSIEHRKCTSTDDESPACHGEQSGSSYRVSFANEVANRENDELSSGDASEDGINDEILLSGEESPEADDRKEIHSNLESSDISNAVAISSTITPYTQVGTSIQSKILVPRTERVEKHEETISRDLDHRIPVDNSACMEMNHCIEPTAALPGMIKSLTTESSFAYDGMDDQFLDHQRRLLMNIHESANFLAPVEGPRREESLANNNAVARDSETSIEASSSWKSLPHEKHYGIDYRERNENDMLQHRRHDMQNRSTLRREKYQSKLPLFERDRQGDYENGSVSSSMFDEPHNSRVHSSDNFVEHDEDKVRLLRMVYELQDELAKSCNLNGNASGRVSTQKDTWAPMYYNHQISQEESWHDSEYPSYSRRSRPQTNYPGQYSLSRMTSAVKAVSGPQVNYYDMEHFPENIPHSMQLLQPEHRHNQGARMAHIDHDYYSQYSSCASSPQHFLGTQLSSRGIRMQSDHMHCNNERNYLRENNHLVKHHLRPMAGGAPFLTCFYCLKLLQIPAEFLLVKRQCNRLKCGHCSKVLEFSLQSRTHIVPYVQSVAEPPPYEPDKLDDSIVLPRSSRQDMEKELSSKWSRNKTENLKKSYQSGDPSSHAYKANKVSSKVGKLSTKSNSPLHRLMGYSSPSQVFRGFNASRRSMK